MVSPPRSHRMMLGGWKAPTPNLKSNFNPLGLILFLLIFLIMFGVFIGFTGNQKTPVTAEQIKSVIVEQGYEPQDITDKYYEYDPAFKATLVKCVTFEEEDIRFDYFEFNNSNSAIDIYGQAYTEIILKYNAIHKIEIDHQMANFSIYTLDSMGKYNVAIYVENTAIYANCNSANKNEINKILDAIDYLEP